jgi:hypothetical protein
LVRVVRQLGESPSACYASELLRSLCAQITLAFGWPCTTIDYELSALSSCFGELLRLVESEYTTRLVIVLDDLQRLQTTGSATLLSWFPCALPSNIHLICSINQTETALLDTLRSRISLDHFVPLPLVQTATHFSQLISSKLRDQHRQLTAVQMQTLLQRFARSLQDCVQNDNNNNTASPSSVECKSTFASIGQAPEEQPRSDSAASFASNASTRASGDRSKSIGDATRTYTESQQAARLSDASRSLSDACKPLSESIRSVDLNVSDSSASSRNSVVPTPDSSPPELISPMLIQLLVDSELISWSSEHVISRPDQLPATVTQLMSNVLSPLERMFGVKMLAKLCAYLACSRYGLREIELHELITSEDSGSSNGARIWLHIKHSLRPFLRQVFILSRPYLQWAHSPLLVEVCRRYVRNEQMRRRIHNELANAFILGFKEVRSPNSATHDSSAIPPVRPSFDFSAFFSLIGAFELLFSRSTCSASAKPHFLFTRTLSYRTQNHNNRTATKSN